MRYLAVFIILSAILFAACGDSSKPKTPFDTFKAYVNAIKKKDITQMKLLLSKKTIEMHENEAKMQNTTLDEIVQRQTLFNEAQTSVEFRNEKIENDHATIEVKNSYGTWESVPFVLEDGDWKIDKQSYVDQMLKDSEMNNQKLDDIINQGRQP